MSNQEVQVSQLSADTLAQSTPTPQDAKGVQSTLSTLYPNTSITSSASFSPQALTLHPPSSPPPPGAAKILQSLVTACQKVATSVQLGSLLAGGGSESDEFSDVGVWLGDLGDVTGAAGVGKEVVKRLGLDAWKIATVKPRDAELPVPWERVPASTSKPLLELLMALEEPVMFSLELPPGAQGGSGGTPVFMVGKVEGGWGGLVGVGVWS